MVRAGEPLAGPHSTAVLLAGLPGDLESENNYRQQLQAWLDFVQSSGLVKEVFVLCDFKDSLVLPNSNQPPHVTVMSADRVSFAGLSRELAGRTNDVLVVAWGHGGTERETPVLHVHGPRLTPLDFKSLAEAMPNAPTRWILMFRGSGTFASEVAGERRQILSSEHDTMFASDPVEMELLLKLARANSATSFPALGQALGRAVADWYKQRNLARTEEPTLWQGADQPRLLAEEAPPSSLEALSVSNAPLPASEAESNGAAKIEPPKSEGLPVVWNEIQRVKTNEYPDADAVVLRSRLSYTLGSSPAIASEQEQFIQILTPEGKHYGDFDISYSPPSEDLSFLDCEVLGADGKLTRLDPDTIREGSDQAVGDYRMGQRKYFSLPGVGPGVVVHVRYRTEWREFPLPHVSLAIPIAGELPIREAAVQVSLPKDEPFHFEFDSSPESGPGQSLPDPSTRQSNYGTTYTWRFQNLAAQPHEILMPPGEPLRLLISTFSDWTDFAQWYGRISKLTDEVTPEIATRASELTRSARTDHEKVVAIYNYVTRLRYVAVPLGVNSFRPHAASNVLENQFGDCKDKANLFNALLHALRLEANLVLVPRFSQAHETVPGLAFNHAISRVTLGADTLWADTTDDVCRFGILPPGDPGRKVLVIDGQTSALTRLPLPDPSRNVLQLDGELDGSSGLMELSATLKAVAQGYPDYQLREAARSAKDFETSLPLLESYHQPVAGMFALEKQSATSVAALDENFVWEAQGRCLGLVTVMPGANALRAPLWLPKEWSLALHHRTSPLFLNQGYPLTLEENFNIKLPADLRSLVLPDFSEHNSDPLRWRLEWKKLPEDKLSVLFHAELVHGELTALETPVFQRDLRQLLGAVAACATFTR